MRLTKPGTARIEARMPEHGALVVLDTCVVQHLDLVWRWIEEDNHAPWTQAASRYGDGLAEELFALGALVDEHQEHVNWAVVNESLSEIRDAPLAKRSRLERAWHFQFGWQSDRPPQCWEACAPAVLFGEAQPAPLALRGLGVESLAGAAKAEGPLGFLPHDGDRRIVALALLAGASNLMTTDLRSVYAHSDALLKFGLSVWKPSELLSRYDSLQGRDQRS